MNPKDYVIKLPKYKGAPLGIKERWWPDMNPKIWNAASTKRKYPLEDIRVLLVHATAGSSSAGAMSVMIKGNANKKKASWQWLIPDEDEPEHGEWIWACCPESRAAWHVRGSLKHEDCWDGRSNISHFSMGVEVVNAQITSDKFSDWQYNQVSDIARYLWSSPKYPNFNTVISHARIDPTRRTDPGENFDWEYLRFLVERPPKTALPKIPLVSPMATDCIMNR